jgi:hypothetical protein
LIILLYIYMYTIFCCGSRAKRASSSSQTSRVELVLWLDCLTSRAEPARARSSRAGSISTPGYWLMYQLTEMDHYRNPALCPVWSDLSSLFLRTLSKEALCRVSKNTLDVFFSILSKELICRVLFLILVKELLCREFFRH